MNDSILFWSTGALFVAFIAMIVLWAIWIARQVDALLRLFDWHLSLNSELVFGLKQFWRIMKTPPGYLFIGLSVVFLLLCAVLWAGMRAHHVVVTLAAPDLMKIR